MKEIYHGSRNIIETPVWGLDKQYNDYGLGFYCTDIIDLAKEWGVDRSLNGYANKYVVECEDSLLLI